MSRSTLPERPYLNSNLFSGHYLDERLEDREEWDCDDEARSVMGELQELYENEQGLVEGYNEASLVQNWIDEVLDVLGFGTQTEVTLPDGSGHTDDLLFGDDATRREAAGTYLDTEDTRDLYEQAVSIVEAKRWDADFTERFSEERPYRNASHQIKHYLERTPENLQWGILTDGRKWRLYGTKDYETETYYEVDLPELLASGSLRKFKYFYLFFRPAAFRESAGTTFLDTVWSESETAARELGEDLQDNVFTALRVLGRGFVETNDLKVDPDDEGQLEELKNQSLVLLYRLMFVLYAEARGLIHPDDPAAEEEYDENFSLDRLRTGIHDAIGEVDVGFDDEYSEHSTAMWNRLETLFGLIRDGEESLGIPPYDGGLFDEDDHEFLTENEVSDQYLAEVIYRLSTTKNGDGRYVLADYADLDTRHLGSVYEGLLEHQFRVAPEQYAAVSEDDGQVWKSADEVTVADAVETVEQGELYVVNDEGERKATGAYYTPDYVVTYIVEETVGPLVDEIEEELTAEGFDPGTEEFVYQLSDRVLDLRVLDPAMGSGHFLTKATGYLAERVMERVRDVESELGAVYDEQAFRRSVAKECIYGVDLNGMAVELAKLSMWLETLAADQPLAFLDHHFKEGNSLVGSDLEEIEELESDGNNDEGQSSLAEFGATREGTIERLMEIYEEFLTIENETLEDARAMKSKYAEIEQDEMRRRLVAMANVYTAERFGRNVPGGAYERMARALEDDEEWNQIEDRGWFDTAQQMAENRDFLHWKLEFPEVFYKEDGSPRARPGFDAIVGNPPYVGTKYVESDFQRYYESVFDSTTGRWDVYCLFSEFSASVSRGRVGFIQPIMFARREYGKGLRRFLSENTNVIEIVDLSEVQVFEEATNYTCILILGGNTPGFSVYTPDDNVHELVKDEMKSYTIDEIGSDPWGIIPPNVVTVIDSIGERFAELKDITSSISEGIHTGYNPAFFLDEQIVDDKEIEDDLVEPVLKGKDVRRYGSLETNLRTIYPYDDGKVIPPDTLRNKYPNVWNHLLGHREELEAREYVMRSDKYWYEIWCERDPEIYGNPKILTPDISDHNNFTINAGAEEFYFNTKVKSIRLSENSEISIETLTGILNSKLMEFLYRGIAPPKRGGYRSYKPGFLSKMPVPDRDHAGLRENVEERLQLTERRAKLNLNLLDYGITVDGQTLGGIGLYQPPRTDSTDSELYQTADENGLAKLKVGTVTVERPDENTAVINATARYKPDDEDDLATDQYGYFETEPIEAFRLTDLSELEADLVEAFVPAATEEAGGFANFRENATKTISLVDRLKALTLPDPDAVEDDLRNYLEAKARAEELDEKIERTNRLIDEIVYELYGLTDEEIEIVEEAVADD